jgi:cytochrome b561
MPMENEPGPEATDRWSIFAIGLHWLTLALIFGLAIVGLLMGDLPNGVFKIQLYGLHKSFGLTVLGLTLLRLLWRWLSKGPAPIAGTPAWQHIVAQATHIALYGLLLALPLSGWLFNSAAGYPLKWFGLFALPRLTGYEPGIKAFAREMHETLFYAMAALIVLHAGAALWHHYWRHDRTLIRMLPILKHQEPKP